MSEDRLSEEKKMQVVMDLLSGQGSHSEVCARYGISQSYLYVLRYKALEGVKGALGGNRGGIREQRLEKELAEAKHYIGDQALVIEVLKKEDRQPGRARVACAWFELRAAIGIAVIAQIHPGPLEQGQYPGRGQAFQAS